MIRRLRLEVVAGALALGLVIAPAASAATIAVTDGGDGPAATGCTLRDAILATNTDAAHGACKPGSGSDTIEFKVPAVTLSVAGPAEDAGATGDLDVTGTLTVKGRTGGTTIDAAHVDRVLDVHAGARVTVQDVTLTGGLAPPGRDGSGQFGGQGSSGLAGESGGGVRNAGTLTLRRVVITGNATSHGGTGATAAGPDVATQWIGGLGGGGGDGGGGASSGALTVSGSVVSGNVTGPGGAGGDGVGPNGDAVHRFGENGDGGFGAPGGRGG